MVNHIRSLLMEQMLKLAKGSNQWSKLFEKRGEHPLVIVTKKYAESQRKCLQDLENCGQLYIVPTGMQAPMCCDTIVRTLCKV